MIRLDREDREIVLSETAKGRAAQQTEKFTERQAKTRIGGKAFAEEAQAECGEGARFARNQIVLGDELRPPG